MPRFTDFGSRRNNRGFTNFSMQFLRVYIWLGARYNIGTLSSPAGLAAGQALERLRLAFGQVLVVVGFTCEEHPITIYEPHITEVGVIAAHGLPPF